MIIGIDASRYNNEEATGVEHYGRQIIDHMLPLLKAKDEVILYSRFTLEGRFKNAKNRVIYSKRFWTLKALSKEIAINPPDILFIPSHVLPLKLAKRSVITVHDLAYRKFKNVYSFIQYNYLHWSTKMAVKKAAKIIVPSNVTKEDLIKIYKCPEEKIEVVHHGFTVPKNIKEEQVIEKSPVFDHFNPINEKYLLFVGRLESKKNLVQLVEAFFVFSKKHPKIKLVLAGKRGVGFKKVLKKIQSKKLNDKIFMPGYVTEEEKAILYKNSELFVFPSLYEGFGLPVLEAFYHRVPVACSNTASLPEVAGKAAMFFSPEDSQEMADVLSKVTSDIEIKDLLIKKGEERLKKFSWEKAAKQTVKVLYG